MSRIGKQPVRIPDGVTVEVKGKVVHAKGPKGERALTLPDAIQATVAEGRIVFERLAETKKARGLHGLSRTLVANLCNGVATGFSKDLVIEGVGFRAQIQGQKILLSLGFASPKAYAAPDGVTVTEQGGTRLTVSGIDKQQVGLVAARIRSYFPAEPYKGKGIRYADEVIRRKEGKTVA